MALAARRTTPRRVSFGAVLQLQPLDPVQGPLDELPVAAREVRNEREHEHETAEYDEDRRHDQRLHVALALILAGALGNLHDRVFCIADVLTRSHSGEKQTIVGKLVDDAEGTPDAYMMGTWPTGEHAQRIENRASWRHHQQGVVRDFVRMEPSITIGERRIDVWPWVFNLADVWLVVGVGLLMLNFWWDRKAEKAAKADAASS